MQTSPRVFRLFKETGGDEEVIEKRHACVNLRAYNCGESDGYMDVGLDGWMEMEMKMKMGRLRYVRRERVFCFVLLCFA